MNKLAETLVKIKNLSETLEELKKSTRKVYAIGRETNGIVAGHGDYYSEVQIRPLGAYGTEGFPPVFSTKEQALAYIENMEYSSVFIPVELILIEEEV